MASPLNTTSNSNWYLITIDDPKFLKSESIFNILQVLLKVVKFKFVILDAIEGSGKKDWIISSLQEKKNNILEIDNLLKILCDINQFDWGDFFIFKDYPIHWDNFKGSSYPYVIRQTDTTIRAVDNQYIYIYTSFEEILNVIKENYEIESIKLDSLDKLDYPE